MTQYSKRGLHWHHVSLYIQQYCYMKTMYKSGIGRKLDQSGETESYQHKKYHDNILLYKNTKKKLVETESD